MGLFFLLTLYAAIRARNSRGDPRGRRSGQRSRSRRARWHGHERIDGHRAGRGRAVRPRLRVRLAGRCARSRTILYAGLAATWVELGVIMWRWPRSTVGGTAVSPWIYALNQAQMIARYLWLSVWPRSLVVDYGVPAAARPRRRVATGRAHRRAGGRDDRGARPLARRSDFSARCSFSRWRPRRASCRSGARSAPSAGCFCRSPRCRAGRRLPAARSGSTASADTLRGAVAAAAVSDRGVAALAIRTIDRNRDYTTPMALWQSVVARRPQGRARFALANELLERRPQRRGHRAAAPGGAGLSRRACRSGDRATGAGAVRRRRPRARDVRAGQPLGAEPRAGARAARERPSRPRRTALHAAERDAGCGRGAGNRCSSTPRMPTRTTSSAPRSRRWATWPPRFLNFRPRCASTRSIRRRSTTSPARRRYCSGRTRPWQGPRYSGHANTSKWRHFDRSAASLSSSPRYSTSPHLNRR